MTEEWTDEQIVEWVTILAIFAFATYPSEMVYLSETSLGKLFFAMIVIYYTMVDPIYGIIACSFVVLYYQLDLYRSYVSLHRDTLLRESMAAMELDLSSNVDNDAKEMVEPLSEGFKAGDSFVYSYSPYDTTDPRESMFLRGSRKSELLSYFRKEHCNAKGQLMNQGSVVRPEMADHVFREIEFPQGNMAKCNPCNPSCEFSVIEEDEAVISKRDRFSNNSAFDKRDRIENTVFDKRDRISSEFDILRPNSSRNAPVDWDKVFGHYVATPFNSIVDDVRNLGTKLSTIWS
jgi:hypothetical protein